MGSPIGQAHLAEPLPEATNENNDNVNSGNKIKNEVTEFAINAPRQIAPLTCQSLLYRGKTLRSRITPRSRSVSPPSPSSGVTMGSPLWDANLAEPLPKAT